MRLTRLNMHIVRSAFDDYSGNLWYKIVVDIPELHLESPHLNTTVYGHELIDKIVKLSDTCPYCKERI